MGGGVGVAGRQKVAVEVWTYCEAVKYGPLQCKH